MSGVTSEYPATIVLDLTRHLFLKDGGCVGINYRQWQGTNFVYNSFFKNYLLNLKRVAQCRQLEQCFDNFQVWVVQRLVKFNPGLSKS